MMIFFLLLARAIRQCSTNEAPLFPKTVSMSVFIAKRPMYEMFCARVFCDVSGLVCTWQSATHYTWVLSSLPPPFNILFYSFSFSFYSVRFFFKYFLVGKTHFSNKIGYEKQIKYNKCTHRHLVL